MSVRESSHVLHAMPDFAVAAINSVLLLLVSAPYMYFCARHTSESLLESGFLALATYCLLAALSYVPPVVTPGRALSMLRSTGLPHAWRDHSLTEVAV